MPGQMLFKGWNILRIRLNVYYLSIFTYDDFTRSRLQSKIKINLFLVTTMSLEFGFSHF